MGENLKDVCERHRLVVSRLGAPGEVRFQVGPNVMRMSEEDSSQGSLGVAITLFQATGISL